MNPIDTHCHIHSPEFFDSDQAESVYKESASNLEAMILVGTSLSDSKDAINFADDHPDKCFASVCIHPREAAKMTKDQITADLKELAAIAKHKSVRAIGECGFDFFYNDKSKLTRNQTLLLEGQLQIASDLGLPLSFHIREGFDEFWPILTNFSAVKGVLHSFSDRQIHLNKALENNLLIGINGIATFTTHDWQIELFRNIPLKSVVLETDSPFLTPRPIRGTINKPINVTYVTNFLAELRGENAEYITTITTSNARKLFRL
mgnify:CR=1 FL=1